MPTRPSKNTANLLWGTCGGKCANPNCDTSVLRINQTEDIVEKIGEIAHIFGAKNGSNRYNPNLSDDERHHYNNLLILCPRCHSGQPDGIDIPTNEERFPAPLLQEWKQNHLDNIHQINDRNWICTPNNAHLLEGNNSISVKFWIDETGQPQLYTAHQLVIVEQLFKLHLSFLQLNEILEMIDNTQGQPIDSYQQTLNDSTISQLYKQSKQLPKCNGYGWIGYLTESLQLAQDITLGELYIMWVENGLRDKAKLKRQNRELLELRASNVDPTPRLTPAEVTRETK